MGRSRGNKNLTVDIQKAIVRGSQHGMNSVELSKQFQCSRQAIHGVLRRFRKEGECIVHKSSGRPRATTRTMDRNICRASRENPRRTAADIQMLVTSSNDPAPSVRTIRRRLQQNRLHERRPIKKPFISEKNRKKIRSYPKNKQPELRGPNKPEEQFSVRAETVEQQSIRSKDVDDSSGSESEEELTDNDNNSDIESDNTSRKGAQKKEGFDSSESETEEHTNDDDNEQESRGSSRQSSKSAKTKRQRKTSKPIVKRYEWDSDKEDTTSEDSSSEDDSTDDECSSEQEDDEPSPTVEPTTRRQGRLRKQEAPKPAKPVVPTVGRRSRSGKQELVEPLSIVGRRGRTRMQEVEQVEKVLDEDNMVEKKNEDSTMAPLAEHVADDQFMNSEKAEQGVEQDAFVDNEQPIEQEEREHEVAQQNQAEQEGDIMNPETPAKLPEITNNKKPNIVIPRAKTYEYREWLKTFIEVGEAFDSLSNAHVEMPRPIKEEVGEGIQVIVQSEPNPMRREITALLDLITAEDEAAENVPGPSRKRRNNQADETVGKRAKTAEPEKREVKQEVGDDGYDQQEVRQAEPPLEHDMAPVHQAAAEVAADVALAEPLLVVPKEEFEDV